MLFRSRHSKKASRASQHEALSDLLGASNAPSEDGFGVASFGDPEENQPMMEDGPMENAWMGREGPSGWRYLFSLWVSAIALCGPFAA